MRSPKTITDLQGRKFNGKQPPQIKRIRQEPRQKIRQLLRSFEPFIPPGEAVGTDPQNQR